MVFHRPHPTKFNMPDPLDGVAQERVAKLLFLLVNSVLRIMKILYLLFVLSVSIC